MNIWQSYKQECGCLMHFVRLATKLVKDEESERDNHVLACNFARYSPILKFLLTVSAFSNKPFLIWLLKTRALTFHKVVWQHLQEWWDC